MRIQATWRATAPVLLLALAAACASQPDARSHGTVEIPLTGADPGGTPHRLHGELTLSRVDGALARTVSTRTVGASDVLDLLLPAGLYTLTLSDGELVGDSTAPCASPAGPRPAWLDSVKPPLIGVIGGQITRVRFHPVLADPPAARAADELETTSAPQSRSSPTCGSSEWHAAEARLGLSATRGAEPPRIPSLRGDPRAPAR